MSKEIAELFFDQCVGEHNGHMASLPNSPLFMSLFKASGYRDGKREFAKILRYFADELDKAENEVPF